MSRSRFAKVSLSVDANTLVGRVNEVPLETPVTLTMTYACIASCLTGLRNLIVAGSHIHYVPVSSDIYDYCISSYRGFYLAD